LLSNYNIKYICTIYTRLDTCLMSISRFSLRDKVTLRLLKLHFYGADVVEIYLSHWISKLLVILGLLILNIIYVWKLNQTVLELDFWAVKFLFFPRRIWTHTIDTLQHLSNYNIKYICTIYTRLDTCLMFISRFSLRDKVTLRLLKLHFYGADVVEWSRALDIRLSDWCCSVSMVWVQIRIHYSHRK
jgi:NADPH-dependent 7-cyano-7-deazaguanine reductase QueF-like protein